MFRDGGITSRLYGTGTNHENPPCVWVAVTCKELRDNKRSLLLTIRASLPLPLGFYF